MRVFGLLSLCLLLWVSLTWGQSGPKPSPLQLTDGTNTCVAGSNTLQVLAGTFSTMAGGRCSYDPHGLTPPGTAAFQNITAGSNTNTLTMGSGGSFRPLGGSTIEANLFQSGTVNLPAISNTGMTASRMYVGGAVAGSLEITTLLECADPTPIPRWIASTRTWSCVGVTSFSPAGTSGVCVEWGPGGTLVDAASGQACGQGNGGGSPGGAVNSIQKHVTGGTFGGFGSHDPVTDKVTLPGDLDLGQHPTDGACHAMYEGAAGGANFYQRCVPNVLSQNIQLTTEDDLSPEDPLVSRNAYETVCFPFENLTATDDDIEFFMARNPVVVKAVGCHCSKGTCTTTAQLSLEDRAGNAMTHTVATCSSGSGNTTWQTVTANGALVGGEGLRFDVDNTPSVGNQYNICVAIQDH